MKKITIYIAATFLLLGYFPNNAKANSAPITETAVKETKLTEARVISIKTRLVEIKEMDKSNLSAEQKKALRKEVRSMKAEIRETNNGLYLSLGAIIIIILLLILLL